MSVDFETKCEQHALDYIKIHLREGYFVNAYVDKGTYYWEKVYKVHAYKKSDAVCESKWRAEQTEPQTDGYMTEEQAKDYRKMLDKAEHKVYGNIEDEPKTDCSWK